MGGGAATSLGFGGAVAVPQGFGNPAGSASSVPAASDPTPQHTCSSSPDAPFVDATLCPLCGASRGFNSRLLCRQRLLWLCLCAALQGCLSCDNLVSVDAGSLPVLKAPDADVPARAPVSAAAGQPGVVEGSAAPGAPASVPAFLQASQVHQLSYMYGCHGAQSLPHCIIAPEL